MSLTLEQVRKVATLARLQLSGEEEVRFAGQLSAILDAFQTLDSLDLAGVEPTSHAVLGTPVLREDEVRPSLPASKSLANAPAAVGTSFAVPKILE